jgi:hypothetical protein
MEEPAQYRACPTFPSNMGGRAGKEKNIAGHAPQSCRAAETVYGSQQNNHLHRAQQALAVGWARATPPSHIRS